MGGNGPAQPVSPAAAAAPVQAGAVISEMAIARKQNSSEGLADVKLQKKEAILGEPTEGVVYSRSLEVSEKAKDLKDLAEIRRDAQEQEVMAQGDAFDAITDNPFLRVAESRSRPSRSTSTRPAMPTSAAS